MFDANNDDKISQLDLFKVMYTLSKIGSGQKMFTNHFNQNFYKDIIRIT